MGCFSYLCKKCERNIQEFDRARGYLLVNGVVVEEQRGRYDLYGRAVPDEKEMYTEDSQWTHGEWGDLVDLHFNDDKSTGFAFMHEECADGLMPTTVSKDDPEQGEPEYDDYEDCVSDVMDGRW